MFSRAPKPAWRHLFFGSSCRWWGALQVGGWVGAASPATKDGATSCSFRSDLSQICRLVWEGNSLSVLEKPAGYITRNQQTLTEDQCSDMYNHLCVWVCVTGIWRHVMVDHGGGIMIIMNKNNENNEPKCIITLKPITGIQKQLTDHSESPSVC